MFGFKLTDYDKKVYEEELVEFLPDKIVDAHTHIFLPEHKKPRDNAKTGTKNKWVSLVYDECGIDDIKQTYLDLFPGKKTIPVIFGTPSGIVEKSNEYISECAKKTGYPALFLNRYGDSAEFIEKSVIEGGFQGLKPYLNSCNPAVRGADADIFDFLPHEHLKVCDKYGWKVVLHISKPDRLKNPTNVKQLIEIEQKYPNVKLIVAHIGRAYSPEDLGDALEVLQKNTKNMMFDFCANTYSYAIEKCIDLMGSKRVLFGTDMPIAKMRMYRVSENGTYINVVPRGMYGDVSGDPHMRETDEKDITNFTYEILRAFKKAATNLSLSKEDIDNIMWKNATDLYGIKF